MMRWYRDLRLRWKLLGAFGIVLLLLVALSVVSYRGVTVNDRSAAAVTRSRELILLADQALLTLVDMETGVRGFLLSGRDDFLEPYTTGVTLYRERLDDLEQASADDPAQVRRWREVDTAAQRWVREYAEPAVRLRREVDAGQRPLTDATSPALAATGKAQFDVLRRTFTGAAADEAAVLAARNAEALAANARLRAVLIGGTVLTGCLALLIALLVAGDLSRVAGHLESAAGRIAAGDLEARTGLRRRDELGVTAAAFDRMAVRLAAVDAERRQAEGGLRAANAELEQFAYTVSHDLKAPLVTIQGFAHRLGKDYAPRLDDAGRRYLTRIEANATHLGDLIEDVLDFSRVGRVGAPPSTVDLDEAVQRALLVVQEMVEARGADVHADGPLPAVVASPTLVGQILDNLLANALTYGAPPGEAPRIEVGCEDLGDRWRLTVRDHGPGIPADQQERLFRLFERLPAGKSVNPGGTGVGLATVRKAAQSMGGTAGVESVAGEGALFWVAFPKVPAGSPGAGAEDPETDDPLAGAIESGPAGSDGAAPALAGPR